MMDINLKALCEWLKDRTDEFTVLDALEACGTPPYATTHDLRVRMGFVLKQIGCMKRARCGEPHEARFFYQPPAARTIEQVLMLFPSVAQVLMLFPSVAQVLMLSPSVERGPDDDAVDRHLDAVLRAAGSALRHYTMQKSLDDMRAAMRAAMTPVPLFDSQCRELCAALGWQGGTYHKVLAEVKRLKAAELARGIAGSVPSLRPRRGEIDLLRWVADDISRQVGEGHGAWRSCSGCHELNEGHDTGPYSHTFRCALGRGCSECGGIGAVWDTTDYQALADAQMGRLTGADTCDVPSPATPIESGDSNHG